MNTQPTALDAYLARAAAIHIKLARLQQVLATPERFAVARKQLDDLIAQLKTLTAEAQTVDGQLTKIAKRLADLKARIAVETKSASRALLDTEKNRRTGKPQTLLGESVDVATGQADAPNRARFDLASGRHSAFMDLSQQQEHLK